MRLGVYADLVYRRDGDVVSTDLSFVLFVAALAEHLDELVVFGRLDPAPGAAPYALPSNVRFVALPHYGSVRDVPGVVRSLRGARTAFAAGLDRLDAVWLFGPHPVASAFARVARRRGVDVFLGVRQDFPQYIAGRLPSRAFAWAVPVAHALERDFRRLARRAPTVAVGEELAAEYRRSGGAVLGTGFSLVRSADLVDPAVAARRSWDDGPIDLLSVGRLDPEKNPLLLPEIVAAVRKRHPRVRLDVVGTGALADAVAARATELGVADALTFHGYVPLGPQLDARYRAAHAFLHVSLTEGLPQVLFEAHAAAIPVVATDVGGVSAALGGGERGLLVPPRDVAAAAAAVVRLVEEPDLRHRLVEAGARHVAEETLEAQALRVVRFFRSHVGSNPPPARAPSG